MSKEYYVELYKKNLVDVSTCPACGNDWNSTGEFIDVDETRYCYCGIKKLIRAEMYGEDVEEEDNVS